MAISIRWNRQAIKQLEETIAFIEKESPASAEKVKRAVLEKIDELSLHPEQHAPDKYKTNNDESYRAFELHHYRISYRYKAAQVRIIRIRHTKMNPLPY